MTNFRQYELNDLSIPNGFTLTIPMGSGRVSYGTLGVSHIISIESCQTAKKKFNVNIIAKGTWFRIIRLLPREPVLLISLGLMPRQPWAEIMNQP